MTSLGGMECYRGLDDLVVVRLSGCFIKLIKLDAKDQALLKKKTTSKNRCYIDTIDKRRKFSTEKLCQREERKFDFKNEQTFLLNIIDCKPEENRSF